MDVKLEYDAGIQSSGDSWKYKHEREFYDGWCCAAVYDERPANAVDGLRG